MPQMSRQDPLIEHHTVDYVPLAERHGKARDLFTLWFSTNIAPLPIVTGAMVAQVFHLNLAWGLLAIVLGHSLGGIVIALASAQGPRMGIPQMVQSRGQFGRYGALLIVFFAALIYIGFFISNIVLAGKSIVGIVPSVPVPASILIGALSATAIGVIGYRFIHTLNRIGTWVMGSALLAGFVYIFAHDLPVKGRERFAGKPVIDVGVKAAVNDAGSLVDRALAAIDDPSAARVPSGGAGDSETTDTEQNVHWARRLQRAAKIGLLIGTQAPALHTCKPGYSRLAHVRRVRRAIRRLHRAILN